MSIFAKKIFVLSLLLVMGGLCLPDGAPRAADQVTVDTLPH